MTTPTASLTPIPLGVCRLIWNVDDPANQVIIDRTKGGCHFKYKINNAPVTADQTGGTNIDFITDGVDAMFSVPMLTSDLAIIQATTPGSTLYTDTNTPANKALLVTGQAGQSLLPFAKKCRLEPLSGTGFNSVTLFIAVPLPQWDTTYDTKNPHVKLVEFHGIPDPAKSYRTFCLGPESALPTT